MKRISIILCVLSLLASNVIHPSSKQATKQENKEQTQNAKDATHEVHALEETQQSQPESHEDEDKLDQVVLANFANIVGNFFTMVQAPNNPQHVGNCLASVANGIYNIIVEAIKSGKLSPDADQETVTRYIRELTKKLQTKLSKIITTKAKQMRQQSV